MRPVPARILVSSRYPKIRSDCALLDTQLIAFQDEQLLRRIHASTVQILAFTGRIEVIRLGFDATLELVLAGVVPHPKQRHDDDSYHSDRCEESFSHVVIEDSRGSETASTPSVSFGRGLQLRRRKGLM
jgi:hypothetical protein